MKRITFVKPDKWTYLYSAICALSVITISLLIIAFVRTSELTDTRNVLNGIYQKSLYETREIAEGISVNLNKLTVAGGNARETLLTDIIKQAQTAQANIGVLPLGLSAAPSAMKFINQVGDFCDTVLGRIAVGGDISESEYSTITQLSSTAAELSLGLDSLLEGYEAGKIELTDTQISDISDPVSEYPTLLYDGPFSDGAQSDVFKALKGLSDISQEDAERVIREFSGAESVTFENESNIYTECYEFSLAISGYDISAAVTKAGGKVLYMMCSSEVTEKKLSENECFQRADAFLLSRGYGTMEKSYYSNYGNVMTINYAATESGAILYPDLIKLQISMENGAVIGLEAGNYLRNHVERALTIPSITPEEAVSRLNTKLKADTPRLCVIPFNMTEKLCYEIRAVNGYDTYLIYVDAMTGDEIEIMRVISQMGGTLVM